MNADQSAPAELDRIAPVSPDLGELSRQIIDLLGQLSTPPRSIQVRTGQVSVELTWHDRVETAVGTPAPPPVPGQAVESVPPAVVQAPPAACLTAPCVGVFYHAATPGAAPFVSVGASVRTGQQIGIIEAMKLMIPVEADRDGEVIEVLKGDGEPVEYAEPLFALAMTPAQVG